MITLSEIEHEVRIVLAERARLAHDAFALDRTANLLDLGLSSTTGVEVLLTLEERLDMEFADELITRQTLTSIETIATATAVSLA